MGSDRYTGMPDSRTYILKTGKASDFEAEMEKPDTEECSITVKTALLPYLSQFPVGHIRTVTYISTSAFAVSI